MSDYCMNIVRQHDHDRFLLSLFAPSAARPALWALFAFNFEIAKTRDVVSETTIGLIRLQWWRDAIAEIYEGKRVRKHEVVQPLAEVIKTYQLPRDLFESLIYAREFDLEGVAPADMMGLLNYCEYTCAPLTQLALKICGAEDYETGVVDISKRYALIGVIRSVPYMIKQHQMLLPQDILERYNLSPQKIFDFNQKEILPKVIDEVISAGKEFRYESFEKNTPKFLRKMQAMADIYEGEIKKVEYDVFSPLLLTQPPFFALKLWVM